MNKQRKQKQETNKIGNSEDMCKEALIQTIYQPEREEKKRIGTRREKKGREREKWGKQREIGLEE